MIVCVTCDMCTEMGQVLLVAEGGEGATVMALMAVQVMRDV